MINMAGVNHVNRRVQTRAWRRGGSGCLQVAKAMPDADHAYMEWVSTYSAPTYQEVPAKLEQLIEDVGNKVTYGRNLSWPALQGI